MKKKENDLKVIFNEDRKMILEGNSWVSTDSLTVASKIEAEHYDVLKRIRKIIKDYNIEVKDKISVTSIEEYISKNTLFKYEECIYEDKQGKERPYYKLSKDLLTLVMFSFKTEKAKQFHKLYIAKFNEMEKELQWFRCRYLGIVTRNSITDAIKDQYTHIWTRHSNIYADFTDLVYTTLYGLKASQIRMLNSEKFKKNSKGYLSGNIRPWLKDDDIKLVEDLEKEICTLIKFNFTYDQIVNMLNERYKTIYNLVLLDEERK